MWVRFGSQGSIALNWHSRYSGTRYSGTWLYLHFDETSELFVLSAGRRKSNCVKEVERIKARREERRAAQQAIREQIEQDYDTSHPQWAFIAMIRLELEQS